MFSLENFHQLCENCTTFIFQYDFSKIDGTLFVIKQFHLKYNFSFSFFQNSFFNETSVHLMYASQKTENDNKEYEIIFQTHLGCNFNFATSLDMSHLIYIIRICTHEIARLMRGGRIACNKNCIKLDERIDKISARK